MIIQPNNIKGDIGARTLKNEDIKPLSSNKLEATTNQKEMSTKVFLEMLNLEPEVMSFVNACCFAILN